MERVRLVEDTALKAAGCKNFAGSIPVLSVYKYKNIYFRVYGQPDSGKLEKNKGRNGRVRKYQQYVL